MLVDSFCHTEFRKAERERNKAGTCPRIYNWLVEEVAFEFRCLALNPAFFATLEMDGKKMWGAACLCLVCVTEPGWDSGLSRCQVPGVMMALRVKMQIDDLEPQGGYLISLHSYKSEAKETAVSLHAFIWGKLWRTECMPGTALSSMTHTKTIKKRTLKNWEFSGGTIEIVRYNIITSQSEWEFQSERFPWGTHHSPQQTWDQSLSTVVSKAWRARLALPLSQALLSNI